jgi:branched-chain amino acid aminotransferase
VSVSDLKVHLNGQCVPASEATISVFDAGFMHGATAFTTMLARNGVVFRLERHLERLMGTVRLLGLACPATVEELTAAAYEVLDGNGLTDARMRITLSPGSAQGDTGPTTLVTADPLPEYPDAWYTEGITVVITSLIQAMGDPTFGYKTGCYFPRVMARQEAAQQGAEEALWFTADKRLAEASFSNVFLVDGEGVVRTPPRDTPVLDGVVRQSVLELCEQEGIPCEAETPLTVHELLDAKEVFITNSTMGLRPVVRVERHAVGEEKPGPVTQQLIAAYTDLLDAECATR